MLATEIYFIFGEVRSTILRPNMVVAANVTPFLAYFANLSKSLIYTQVTLKKSIPNKWRSKISPSTSPRWNLTWHKHIAQKGVAFFSIGSPQGIGVNEWRGRILAILDKSCMHCGMLMGLVEHRFFNYLKGLALCC